MPVSRENLSAKQPQRLEALQARHADIERQIQRELNSPGASDESIKELKLRKLRLKDEIEERRSYAASRH